MAESAIEQSHAHAAKSKSQGFFSSRVRDKKVFFESSKQATVVVCVAALSILLPILNVGE